MHQHKYWKTKNIISINLYITEMQRKLAQRTCTLFNYRPFLLNHDLHNTDIAEFSFIRCAFETTCLIEIILNILTT